MAKNNQGFVRWFISYYVTDAHFKNTITLMLVSVYCVMMMTGMEVDSQFSLLVGMVLGFYFKRGEK